MFIHSFPKSRYVSIGILKKFLCMVFKKKSEVEIRLKASTLIKAINAKKRR